MAPVIGITPSLDDTRFYINKEYVNAVEDNGAIPFILSYKSLKNIPEILSKIDGLLLSGGGDMDASFFGEKPHPKINFVYKERDEFELAVYRAAVKLKTPVLGICRGLQVINVAQGGTLIQHIENHSFTDRRKDLIHEVNVDTGSILYKIIGNNKCGVNSLHHQAIGKPGKGVAITAWSEDNIAEAIEVGKDGLVFAVQWHPEELYAIYEEQRNLFKYFIDRCI